MPTSAPALPARRPRPYPTAKRKVTVRMDGSRYDTAVEACHNAGSSFATQLDRLIERLAAGKMLTEEKP